MPRITEQLVRKRSEHNDGDITTLEELSLHQQDLEKIEHLDRWCKQLKILYLQNNLIPCIENVARLKQLQYLNLALNNIERIENLEGCEFLQKLDFTVNFIGDLLSVESLCSNLHLQELFLTGNPCTDYQGYRDFVVATLPQLVTLDGKEISKSERIAATQQLKDVRCLIATQQQQHALKREREKMEFKEKHCTDEDNTERKPGFDGRWYTDPQAHVSKELEERGRVEEVEEEEEEEAYTPEYRKKSCRDMAKKKMEQAKEPENKLKMPTRMRTLERDGKMLNVNEGRYRFQLKDEGARYVLEVECPRYMETSLIDCDIQPTYVTLNIKSKVLQLVLDDEISPDSSTVKRSQVTGHLLLDLPKTKPVLQKTTSPKEENKQRKKGSSGVRVQPDNAKVGHDKVKEQSTDNAKQQTGYIDRAALTNIAHSKGVVPPKHLFQDDPDVPPLI